MDIEKTSKIKILQNCIVSIHWVCLCHEQIIFCVSGVPYGGFRWKGGQNHMKDNPFNIDIFRKLETSKIIKIYNAYLFCICDIDLYSGLFVSC